MLSGAQKGSILKESPVGIPKLRFWPPKLSNTLQTVRRNRSNGPEEEHIWLTKRYGGILRSGELADFCA